MDENLPYRTRCAKDLARLTHGAPLLAACAVSLGDMAIGLLNQMETYSRLQYDRRRHAVDLWSDLACRMARSGPPDAVAMVRILADGWSRRTTAEHHAWQEATAIQLQIWQTLVQGLSRTAEVGTKTATVLVPEHDHPHSTPL